MKNIQLDITKAAQFLHTDAIAAYEPQVKAAQEALENGTCPGNDFLGWLHLPSSITPEFIAELNATAQVLRENCEVVVVAGIGGSYLGARTVIEALSNSFQWLLGDKKNPVILFAGNNIGEDYLAEMCDYLKDKKFGVINISSEGKQQWVNPAAYLAEINQKGNLQKQAQYNGKDLLAQYQAGGTLTPPTATQQQQVTPNDWLTMLMSSDDSALALSGQGEGGGLLDSIMKMFMTMLLLSMQMENKSKEEKMETVTDALVNRRIDISGFTPNLKSAMLTIKDSGTAVLTTDDGQKQYVHELTSAEQSRLSQVLGSDVDDATKRQRIGAMVSAITFSQQASQNYEQIVTQQQSQEQNLQRK